MTDLQQLKKDFEELNLFKIFEIEVLDKEGKQDYIIFNISIEKRSLVASHVALTKKEERSTKIAYKSIVIDSDFSLNENLQELYEECTTAIIDSDFFTLV